MILGDDELKSTRVIGIDLDPETTATARKMGLAKIAPPDDLDAIRKYLIQ